MLKDFRLTSEERPHETERADRPSIMVAPDKKKEACCEQGPGQKKPGPSPEWYSQRLPQLTETDDEYQHAGKVMIELGIGDPCYRSFPPWLITHGPIMFVVDADGFMHQCLIKAIGLRPQRRG